MLLAGIQANDFDDVSVRPSLLAGIEADGAHDLMATRENLPRRVSLQNEFILRPALIMWRST
jgi:hypothetical protein